MHYLILGGTRLLGRALLDTLCRAGHRVTVSSRRRPKAHSQITSVIGERSESFRRHLRGLRFDATLDFTCYDEDGVDEVFENIDPGTYILISTAWLPRLFGGADINALAECGPCKTSSELPDITRRYLEGKSRAENRLAEMRETGRQATILRLPIFLGAGDHTGRLDFYRCRMADGGPLILVDSGANMAQLAWTDDLAHVITSWLTERMPASRLVWNGLPHEGQTVREIILEISRSIGADCNKVSVSALELAERIPNYLSNEPFWRESSLTVGPNNLFSATNRKPTPMAEWLKRIPFDRSQHADDRMRELSLIREHSHD
jgi:nucleoside-diphosphate-sugar epimerase